jgi:hypothetical protein
VRTQCLLDAKSCMQVEVQICSFAAFALFTAALSATLCTARSIVLFRFRCRGRRRPSAKRVPSSHCALCAAVLVNRVKLAPSCDCALRVCSLVLVRERTFTSQTAPIDKAFVRLVYEFRLSASRIGRVRRARPYHLAFLVSAGRLLSGPTSYYTILFSISCR